MSAAASLFRPGRRLSRDQEYLVRYPEEEVVAAWETLAAGEDVGPHRFGFYQEVEKLVLRRRLIAQGVTDPTRLHFALADAFVEAHRNDESFASWQARNRHRWTVEAPPPLAFTVEELERLEEHFAGANDPTAQAIAAKVARLLGRDAPP